MHNLLNGRVRDTVHHELTPTKYNVGVLGQGKYSCASHRKIYDVWSNMLQRCYSKVLQTKEPSYVGCEVCLPWQNFQIFARWYEDNCPNEDYSLDKDIKIKGNKLYSPDTVLFVPPAINKLFVKQHTQRGCLPIGVQQPKKYVRFLAVCTNPLTKTVDKIGLYDTPEQAFMAYKEHKELIIRQMAEIYKSQISPELYKAMLDYEVEITD